MVPSWFKPFAYLVCAVNSLLLLLFAVDYLLCEIDLFLFVWISSMLLLVTVPLGLALFVYSLFRLRHKEGRVVAIWSLALVAAVFVVFWLLPSGSSRVPSKMETHCIKHEATMLSLAADLYGVMPDSSMLEYSPAKGARLSHIASWENLWGYPGIEDSIEMAPVSLTPSQIDSVTRVMESFHCDELTIYKPKGLAMFKYLTCGFASYWFEVSLTPYTEAVRQGQLNIYNVIPFSQHVCFRYHGGAIGGDDPFPYKEEYVETLKKRGMIPEQGEN